MESVTERWIKVWVSRPVTGLSSRCRQRLDDLQDVIVQSARRSRPVGTNLSLDVGGALPPGDRDDIHPSEISYEARCHISEACVFICIVTPVAQGVTAELLDAEALGIPIIILYGETGSSRRKYSMNVDTTSHRRTNPSHLRHISRLIRDHSSRPHHYIAFDPENVKAVEDVLCKYWRQNGRSIIDAGLQAQKTADANEGIMARTCTSQRRILGLTCADVARLLRKDSNQIALIGKHPRYLRAWRLGDVNRLLEVLDAFATRETHQGVLFAPQQYLLPESLNRIAASYRAFGDAVVRLGLEFWEQERLWFDVREADPAPIVFMDDGEQNILRRGAGGQCIETATLWGLDSSHNLTTRMPVSVEFWIAKWKEISRADR